MKIFTLNYCCADNYGAVVEAYSLQKYYDFSMLLSKFDAVSMHEKSIVCCFYKYITCRCCHASVRLTVFAAFLGVNIDQTIDIADESMSTC